MLKLSGLYVCIITLPFSCSLPALPATCVKIWNVFSFALKSSIFKLPSAAITATKVTFGKWWPFTTICVPIKISIFSFLNLSNISSWEFFLLTVSTSILIVLAVGNILFISASNFCVPVPKYLILLLLHSGHIVTAFVSNPQ